MEIQMSLEEEMKKGKKINHASSHILKTWLDKAYEDKYMTPFRDLVSNALDANAKKVTIEWTPKFVRITDDGDGFPDINSGFTLGQSESQFNPEATGLFGIGVIAASLYFGWILRIDTIRDGRYHTNTFDWEAAYKANDADALPEWYDAKRNGRPSYRAPEAIRKGGSIITISNRHTSRGRVWQIESLAENLTQVYKPALATGINIILKHGSEQIKLVPPKLNLKHIIEVKADINGKRFKLRAGINDLLTIRQQGIHLGFGHQFMRKLNNLPNEPIPPSLYGEILLSLDWKDYLTSDKRDLKDDPDSDALVCKVEALLKEILKNIHYEIKKIKLSGLEVKLQTALSDKVGTLNKLLEGKYKKRHRIKPPHPVVPPPPNPDPKPFVSFPPAAEIGGDFDNNPPEEEDAPGSFIYVQLVPGLDNTVSKAQINNKGVFVDLNEDVAYLQLGMKDLSFLLGIAFNTILDACILGPDSDQKKWRSAIPYFDDVQQDGNLSLGDTKQRLMYMFLKAHDKEINNKIKRQWH